MAAGARDVGPSSGVHEASRAAQSRRWFVEEGLRRTEGRDGTRDGTDPLHRPRSVVYERQRRGAGAVERGGLESLNHQIQEPRNSLNALEDLKGLLLASGPFGL